MKKQIKPLIPAILLALFSFSAQAVTMSEWNGNNIVGDPDVQIGSGDALPFIGINNITLGKVSAIQSGENGNITIYGYADAVQVAYEGAAVNIGAANTNKVSLIASNINNRDTVIGINAIYGVDVSLNAQNIEISVDGGANGEARGLSIGDVVEGYSQTVAQIGSEATENLTITANGNKGSMGVFSLGAITTLQAKNIEITSNGSYGVLVQNSTQFATAPKDTSRLIIKGENTTINAPNGSGLMAFSNGYLEVSGNLTVNALNAIDARGYSTINVNQYGTGTVVLNGDIAFETPGPSENSGDIINANVNVNLTGAGSSWTGNAYKHYPKESEGNEGLTSASGLQLTLANGAQWNPTLVTESEDETSVLVSQAVNQLSMNGGVINVTHGSDQVVEIENIQGSGGTVNMLTQTSSNGSLSTASLVIESVSEGSSPELNVNYTGITADDMVGSQISDIQGGVDAPGVAQTKTVAQGAVMGAITERVDAMGNVVATSQAENTRLNAYGSVASLGILQWRHEMNDLTKRMGELRLSPEGVGSWARLYGSEQEYGDQDVTSKNTTVQVGVDFDVGYGWKVGAAFSYTDGSADYDAGDADNKGYGVGVYGTWMSESGQFIDLIAKYNRLDTDFQLEGMDGSYDNNAFSISAEYGWHFKLAEVGFVEPQAEITYGRVMGEDFNTSNGVRIEQDDFDSLIGRIGVRAGFNFPDNKGTLYARVSGLHDFQGDFKSKASLIRNATVSQDIEEDLGDTWVEFGVGANINWTENTYTYIDLERSNGGDIKENWRWNVGIRHTF